MAKRPDQTVIQSFLNYPHRVPLFKEDGKPYLGPDGNKITLRIPPLSESPKNLLVTTPEFSLALHRDTTFMNFVKVGMAGGVKILEGIPENYWSAQEQVAAIMAKEAVAKEEAAKMKALADTKDKEIEELKAKLKAFGSK